MRLLLLLAIAFFIVALVCYVVPTVFLFGALGWTILGWLCIALDLWFEWTVAVPTRSRPGV